MSKKKSNVKERISQTTYFYKGNEARKRWYGWDENQIKNGSCHNVEAKSVRERMEYVLKLADERGFVLTSCDLEFNQISSDSIRKEVKFSLDNDNNLKELGFETDD